jgi:anthranilate phosphoribosyltransferase
LQSATHATVTAAVDTARAQAAALADGDQLDVETPPSITELHRAAAEEIDESQFDPDKVGSAGERTVRRTAENAALEELVAAGNWPSPRGDRWPAR